MSGKSNRNPLIVAFIGDLMVTTKIEGVSRHLGYDAEFVGDAAEINYSLGHTEDHRPGEPIDGISSELISQLTSRQPSLLIFDLNNGQIPWREWIRIIKLSPATRRIPVLCFGPHIDVDALAEASSLSVTTVPRSRFMSAMAELLEQNIRVTDYAAISKNCQESMSDDAYEGLLAFNLGHYFESHELLEDAWNHECGPSREAYRGVLQIAVAYLQIERGNFRGATKMFLRARQWLDPLPDICRGINIQKLRTDAETVFAALNALGPESISDFDRRLFRPIIFVRPTIGNGIIDAVEQ